MTAPDELERAVERITRYANYIPTDPFNAKDLRLLLSERAELLASVERMRVALESAAETLEHVMTAMADAGAVPGVGTWRFVNQAAKRARAALTTGEGK